MTWMAQNGWNQQMRSFWVGQSVSAQNKIGTVAAINSNDVLVRFADGTENTFSAFDVKSN